MKLANAVITFVAICTLAMLVACQPAATAVPSASMPPAATPAASQAPAMPGSVPVSGDIQGLLVASGDLPAGYTPGPITDTLPNEPGGMPAASLVVGQKMDGPVFAVYMHASAMVGVRVYARAADAATGYQLLAQTQRSRVGPGDSAAEHSDIGEQALSVASSALIPNAQGGKEAAYSSAIVFARCRAVITIAFLDAQDRTDTVLSYARSLDGRLRPLLCQ